MKKTTILTDRYKCIQDIHCGGWYIPIGMYEAGHNLVRYKCDRCRADKLVTEHDALKDREKNKEESGAKK